jgi:hypothetical protein
MMFHSLREWKRQLNRASRLSIRRHSPIFFTPRYAFPALRSPAP